MGGFWGILKREMYCLNRFEGYEGLVAAIGEYIHPYNYERRRRMLDRLAPMSYRRFLQNAA